MSNHHLNTNTNIEPNDCLQLAAVYELLSCLWLEELNAERLKALGSSELRQAIESLGGSVPAEANAEMVETLAIDYCQLFIGPKDQLAPIQSVYKSGQFQSPTAASCNRFYEMVSGYELKSTFPDHLGVQLGFMSFVLNQAAHSESREAYLEIGTQFNDKHLGWTADYLNAVEEKATTDFYRGLAIITRVFLNEDFHETK